MNPDPSTSHVKHYKAYFSPEEVERLSAKQRGKLSVSREERARQQACGFIDAVGARCGFPRRTIANAQTLYMRFHLFFPYREFSHVEVSLTTLYVSSKLHDTLKKPRDIILASYAVRFPQLIKRGQVDPAAVEANLLEGERNRVMSIERLVLETLCFKFKAEVGLGLVIKLGKAMGAGKELCQQAWRVAVDCHRTLAPLSFPPHVIAIGSLYTASMLLMENTQLQRNDTRSDEVYDQACALVMSLGASGDWETRYAATVGHADDVAHSLLDLYILVLSTPPSDPLFSSPSPVSPKEQPIPSAGPHSVSTLNTAFKLSAFWTAQTLTELKIHLRQQRPNQKSIPIGGWPVEGNGTGKTDDVKVTAEGMGSNDSTVRFIWEEGISAA